MTSRHASDRSGSDTTFPRNEGGTGGARDKRGALGGRGGRKAHDERGTRSGLGALRRGLLTGVAAACLLVGATRAAAQVAGGDLDVSFGVGGELQLDINHSTDIAKAVAVQPDGKLVVVGMTYLNNNYATEDFAVVRLLPDGTPDDSFGVNGRVTTDFPGLAAVPSAVLVQPDGKILVAGGAFPLFTFLGDFKLVRYNEDGSLDTSFGTGGIVTTEFPGQGSYAFALALQPDGRIVAAGTDFVNFSTSQSSNTDFAIARYHDDGSPDMSFSGDGKLTTDFLGFNDDAFSVLVQPDGRLVAFGSAVSLADPSDIAGARYLENGALDPGFGIGGKLRTNFGADHFDQARSAVLQPDGRIVVAGFTLFNGGLSQPFALARYDDKGRLDGSFDGDGLKTIDFGSFSQTAYSVLLQPDGRLVTLGFPNSESSDSDFLVARCLSDGTLDASFGDGGKVRTSFGDLNGGAYGGALQPDGRIVAVGFQASASVTSAEFALARYEGSADGWVDQGGPLAGTLGDPELSGTGDLSAGSSNSITLAHALPNTVAGLFVALSSAPVPFKGGVLQTFPFLGPFLLGSGPAGHVTIPFVMPTGLPGGTEIWLQFALQDGGAVQGVALSNAIRGVTP